MNSSLSRQARLDDDVRTFLTAGFTQRQILDVITGVAVKTLSNYAKHLAHTPLDDAMASFAWSDPR